MVNDHEKIQKSPTGVEPLDKWVLYFRDKLEKFYRETYNLDIELTAKDLLDVRKDFVKSFKKNNWLPTRYFQTMEIPSFRAVMRYPDGQEIEVINFGEPDHPMQLSLDTQNFILIRMLELKLKEKEFEHYIGDMLGETAGGKKIEDMIKENYPYLKRENKEEKIEEKIKKPFKRPKMTLDKIVNKVAQTIEFVKPGDYEVNFIDRIASLYFKEMASFAYVPILKYIKSGAGFPV